jgi:hypothetical protein
MGVASCRGIFLCLMPCLIACLSSLISVFVSRLDSDQWLCVSWDFDPRRDPARPSLAQPGPALARTPWHPCPSPHAPPPFSSFLSFNFPAHNSLSPISLSSPLCPRCSGDGYRRIWIPKVSSPLLSLSLSLSPLPPLPYPCALPCSPLRACPPGASAVRLPSASLVRPLASPAAAPLPPLGVAPRPPRRGPSALPGAAVLAPGGESPGAPRAWPLGLLVRGPRPPGGAAPWPPAARLPRHPPRGRPSPCARPLPSAAWSPGAAPRRASVRLVWPRRDLRGLVRPRFAQRVPACAAPRAR